MAKGKKEAGGVLQLNKQIEPEHIGSISTLKPVNSNLNSQYTDESSRVSQHQIIVGGSAT